MGREGRLRAMAKAEAEPQYYTFYEGAEIPKHKSVVDQRTGYVQRYNAVYLPETPQSKGIPKHRDFVKVYRQNAEYLQRFIKEYNKAQERKYQIGMYEFGVLHFLESLIQWECNVVAAKVDGVPVYVTAADLHNLTGFDRKALGRALDNLARVGVIRFIRGMRNEKRIAVNPHLAYQGNKIDQWLLDCFVDAPFQPLVKIQFDIKERIEVGDGR